MIDWNGRGADFSVNDTSHIIKNTTRMGARNGRISKVTSWAQWHDTAVSERTRCCPSSEHITGPALSQDSRWIGCQIIPLYVSIGAGVAMCAYVCALKLATYPDIVYVHAHVHVAIAPNGLGVPISQQAGRPVLPSWPPSTTHGLTARNLVRSERMRAGGTRRSQWTRPSSTRATQLPHTTSSASSFRPEATAARASWVVPCTVVTTRSGPTSAETTRPR